jgi:formylglycine-generating enzyme required for sulfatase activity
VALADERVALVVGNSAYKHAGELANPVNDAGDMATALKRKGFAVIEAMNLNRVALVSKVQEFGRAAAGAEIALFFYAGHGIQVSGQNYLVPVDAQLETAAAVATELLPVSLIYSGAAGSRFTIVVLDACRDNPLYDQLKQAMGERSSAVGRGLAREGSAPGGDFLVSFSTQPGNVALDGDHRNSPFTTALLKHLAPVDPNRDLAGILEAVRADVVKATRRQQIPWDTSSLQMPLYLDRPKQPELSEAARAWRKVNKSSFVELEAFITRYSGSPEANRARNSIQMPTCMTLPGRATGCIGLVGRPTSSVRWFKDCPQCPELIIAPWGHSQMGSPDSEPGRGQGEDLVRITFPHFYAAARFKVTTEEWNACVTGGGCKALSNGSRNLPTQPVDVTYWDARAYAKWLSGVTRRNFRLPSEAEWEHIIRAEKTTPYWWGSTIEDRPGSRVENWWYVKPDGLEWVEDCWNPSNRGAPLDGQARSSGDCTRYAVRGSKDNHPTTLRSAHRSSAPPDTAGIGFRVVSTFDR